MGSLLYTLAAFIVALAILIAVHEFGHFWVARKLGVKVLRFSIGFGKVLWKRTGKVDGTEYVLAAIPLGGYVKMLDEREAPVADSELDRAFNRQSLPVRSAVVIAGPLFNFLFAIFAYWLIFVTGDVGLRPIVGEIVAETPAAEAGFVKNDEILKVGDRLTPTWEATVYALLASSIETDAIEILVRKENNDETVRLLDLKSISDDQTARVLDEVGIKPRKPELPAVIGAVIESDPAWESGLQPGDRILSINDKKVGNWSEWVVEIRKLPEKPSVIEVQRDGQILTLSLTPKAVTVNDEVIGRIGASAFLPDGFEKSYQATVRYGVWESLPLAIDKTWDLSALTIKVLGKMIIGEASVKNLSGPITIAQAAGKTASIGYLYFLKFLAVVSISLGVLNLLPIPVLDGGHLFFFALEAIKGSPLSEGIIDFGQKIGLVLLAGLMSLAFYVDLSRFLG